MIRTLWAAAAPAADHPAHHAEGHPEDHPADHGTDPDPGLLGLCLAVLVGAALALVGLSRPLGGVLALVPRASAVASTPARERRDHAPPDLFALAVQRC